jgi:hypothetical protein
MTPAATQQIPNKQQLNNRNYIFYAVRDEGL